MTTTVYILIGSNLGDRYKNLTAAVTKLEAVPGLEVIAQSGIYVSEAQGMQGENPSFMNQVVKVDYQYLSSELLNVLELIEKNLGRIGKGKKEPRPMDLDILLFGDEIIETDTLSVPHRELLNRPFAMVPLLEIDPELVHPVTKRPVAEFLSEEGREEIILYKDQVARQI
ncbi:MAG: 2-amino-4-hydroxy-6-hydroxymethyldihydropteridine diphosphokinase [candidate division Zixibacteria bacterium]|nr:2-amino-4-hydroxy-6-hydroxymethyldihydropteridine diphosphokinase [candidate division Zixibacteria bacterium]